MKLGTLRLIKEDNIVWIARKIMEKINKAAIALTITNVFHYALLCKKKMREHSGKMAK